MKIVSLFGAALLASVSGAAIAADLPSRKVAPAPVYAAPVFTWSGFYIGVNAGGVISRTTGRPDGITPNILFAAPGLPTVNSEKFGFLGGGQVGFNYQTGSFVFGVEGDIDFSTAKDTRGIFVPTAIPGFAVVGNAQAKLDYLATIRGRIGYTITPAFLAINGIQTLSHAFLDLSGDLAALVALGATDIRLSPHSLDMVAVARIFRDALDQRISAAEAREAMRALDAPGPFANGFFHGRAGHLYIEAAGSA